MALSLSWGKIRGTTKETDTVTIDIKCPPLYYGNLCEEKQDVTASMKMGLGLLAVGIVAAWCLLFGGFSKSLADSASESLTSTVARKLKEEDLLR